MMSATVNEHLLYIQIYRKQQKFRGTKLSRFTGFYQNVGKTFAFLLQFITAYQRAAIVFERISHVN